MSSSWRRRTCGCRLTPTSWAGTPPAATRTPSPAEIGGILEYPVHAAIDSDHRAGLCLSNGWGSNLCHLEHAHRRPVLPPAVPVVVLPGMNSNEGPLATWRFKRPPVNGQPQQQTFVYEQMFNPFQVVVEPVAVAQTKVSALHDSVPAAGGQEHGHVHDDDVVRDDDHGRRARWNRTNRPRLKTRTSRGLVRRRLDKNFLAFLGSAAGGSGSSGDASSVTNFLKGANLSAAMNWSSSTTWDDTTRFGSGMTTTAATTQTSNFQAVTGWTLQKVPSLVPGGDRHLQGGAVLGRSDYAPRPPAGRHLASERTERHHLARCSGQRADLRAHGVPARCLRPATRAVPERPAD